MKKLQTSLAVALLASFGMQAALAADAKKPAAQSNGYEETTEPKARSDNARKDVKAEAKGAATDEEASKAPVAQSTKKRAEVRADAKKAVRSGEIPVGEQQDKPKK